MAASEETIRAVLKMMTSPSSTFESMSAERRSSAEDLRSILVSGNIVGVGIAEKRRSGAGTGFLALTFYVRHKMSKAGLSGSTFVPPILPESVSGSEAIPTDVVELGVLVPQANVTRDPVQPGNSVGHPETLPGTFGAVVRDGGVPFLLSNCHVLARNGAAPLGAPILYPGASVDGGQFPADVVGQLARFEPLIPGGAYVNRVDAAVATFSPSALQRLRAEIRTLEILPAGTVQPFRGMRVEKVGRTSDFTIGEVLDIDFCGVLPYPGFGSVGFLQQVLCTPYTQGGDSGSLVLESGSSQAVGLHVGGAQGGSMFSRIDDVLSALNVRL